MAVGLNFNRNAILYKLTEKQTLNLCFNDAAGKIDNSVIFVTSDGAVGAGRKGLSHDRVKTDNMFFHFLRHLDNTHIRKAGRGLLVLDPLIKLAHDKVLMNSGTARSTGCCCVYTLVVISAFKNLSFI